MKRSCVFAICWFFSLALLAQDIQIQSFQVAENGIISFDFTVSPKYSLQERYTVYIYSSADNFQKPLSVSFTDVIPNQSTIATINGPMELQGYSGPLSFKLSAVASLFPVRVLNAPKKLIKGREFIITWESIRDRHSIELVDKNNRVIELSPRVAGRSYTGETPGNLKRGKYQLRITPVGQSEAATVIPEMRVAGKPMWKFMAIGGAGVVTYVILNILDDDGTPGVTEFPDPPRTPDGT